MTILPARGRFLEILPASAKATVGRPERTLIIACLSRGFDSRSILRRTNHIRWLGIKFRRFEVFIFDLPLWNWIAVLTLYLVGVVFVAGMTWPNLEGWRRIVAVVLSALSWVGLAIILAILIIVILGWCILRVSRFLAKRIFHLGDATNRLLGGVRDYLP